MTRSTVADGWRDDEKVSALQECVRRVIRLRFGKAAAAALSPAIEAKRSIVQLEQWLELAMVSTKEAVAAAIQHRN